jgi:hypothetical protein
LERWRPAGYALRDGDGPIPTPSLDCPQDFVRFIRLGCRDAENLYLTDPVLASLGLTWEQAVEKITAASGNHGEMAEMLRSVAQWDRASQDLKPVIREVSSILDLKRVDWCRRIGAVLSSSGRPSGNLATFLGTEVIQAIWG